MKKFATIGVIFIALLMLFAACASGNPTPGPSDNPNATEAPSEPTTPPVLEKTIFEEMAPVKQGTENTHFTFTTKDDGFDVYAPLTGKWGYRYAPSIIYYNDGTWDTWYATPGKTGEWDWFTYKSSTDGKTFTNEKLVLVPTPDSMDHYSVCDPGVIYFNGYYYLGYTSTIVSTNGGINNNVFVSRSTSPTGPFEKWNGSGWGGDPAPIVYYDEYDAKWGAGEPSFVVVNDVLYIYYTWNCSNGDYKMVATADATSENWPATMVQRGLAFKSTGDQADVVYVEDTGMWLAFCTKNRFTDTAGIQIMESLDGITFTTGEFISSNIAKYCHNMGISKRPNGHIQLSDDLMIGYAYAQGGNGSDYWGKWPTRFQRISLSYYEGTLNKSDKGKNGVLIKDYYWDAPKDPTPIGITTNPHIYKTNLSKPVQVVMNWVDATITTHDLACSDVTFTDYDESIISISNDGIVTPKAVGATTITAKYQDHQVVFKVTVYPDGFDFAQKTPEIVKFEPVYDTITMYLNKVNGAKHQTQIRGYVEFADGTWGEAYNDYTKDHKDYPAMVPAENYLMTYEVANPDIIKVNNKGVITAKAVGETTVTVTITGGKSFTVTVKILEGPAS